jgi:hypothetical protein
LLDSSVDAPPPDSAVPLDSTDYLSAPKGAPPAPPPHAKPEAPPAEAKAKRLPQPPPTPHLPKVAAREANGAEPPSETSVPKVSDLALESSPLQLSQKKGEPKGRRRQASGDLTDDLLAADVGFDAAPAIAPPDAGALTRAPVSSRPAPAAGTSTKAPVSRTSPSEKKSSGRGVALLLVVAAFGGVGYVLRHRANEPEPPKPEPQAAVNVAPQELPTPPAETATPPAEAPSAAPAGSAAAAPPEPSATAPAVAAPPAATPPGPAPVAATPKTPKPAAEAPATPSEKVATTATGNPAATAPTSPAVVEPRGSAGTEPFDVGAARSALDATATQASGCRKEGDPSGVAVVTITFSQTGRVTTANISGPPFQATPTGGCIASTMRKTRVPSFAGEMVTVRKTVTIQ